MDSFFNLVQTEQWRRIIKCERYTKGLIKYSTYVYIAEYSGVDVRKDETLSQRYDQTFFIPLLIIEKLPDKFHNLVEDCKNYQRGKIPVTIHSTPEATLRIRTNEIAITLRNDRQIEYEIELYPSDLSTSIIKSCENISLGICSNETGLMFSRVSTQPAPPFPKFPMLPANLMNHKGESRNKMKQAIKQAPHYRNMTLARIDSYLDSIEGSNDYDVYQSTSTLDSLPKVTKLGMQCWTCGKYETTREHCSPKWLSDSYKVKPLVAPLLCKSCNSWFGLNIEIPASLLLKSGQPLRKHSEFEIISKWCIKTALFMSLASGARFPSFWLQILKNNEIPDGFEVYYSTKHLLNEPGFNYGVSRFSHELVDRGTFLFTMSTPTFTMIVIRNIGRSTRCQLPMIYPDFTQPSGSFGSIALADIHETLHEAISQQITLRYDLPSRIPTPRD